MKTTLITCDACGKEMKESEIENNTLFITQMRPHIEAKEKRTLNFTESSQRPMTRKTTVADWQMRTLNADVCDKCMDAAVTAIEAILPRPLFAPCDEGGYLTGKLEG